MIGSLKAKYKELCCYYNNFTATKIVFLRGNKGLGKTSVIEKFLENKQNVMILSSYFTNEPYLQPIINAIRKFEDKYLFDFTQNGLSYTENITRCIFEIASKNSIILYNQFLIEYPRELIEFFIQMCSNIIKNSGLKKMLILVELDTDSENFNKNKEYINELYSLGMDEEFINFSPLTHEEMEQEFMQKCGINCVISDKSKEYIIESASGNIRLLQIIINYLKQNEFLYLDVDSYKYKEICPGSLSDVLEKYIELRYNRLSNILKNTLQKSRLFGMEFSVIELTNTFKIIEADEALNRIEHLSQLVKANNENDMNYSFENDEVYIYVKNRTAIEDLSKWSFLIASYYQTMYEKLLKENLQNSFELSYKTAYYFEKSGNYEKATSYYISSIKGYFSALNYRQALLLIEQVDAVKNFSKIHTLLLIEIDTMHAECYEHIGLYDKALVCYKKNAENYSNLYYFDNEYNIYKIAFCTYYTSNVYKAKSIVDNLLIEFNNSSRTDDLYYKILSLAATLYQQLGDVEKTLNLFYKIIEECRQKKLEKEYYTQLRKSDYCLDIHFTIPLLIKAKEYFKKVSDYKEYAKTILNLGVDNIYVKKMEVAKKYIQEAINLFTSYGSIDILYAYNAYGVYIAIYEQDYNKALKYFEKANYSEMNAYKKVSVLLNQAMCYLKLQKYEKCAELIRIVELLPERKINKNVAHYHRSLYFAWAFYFYNLNMLQKSLEEFKKCFSQYLKNGQRYLAAQFIYDINNKLCLLNTKENISLLNMSHDILYDIYHEEALMFHTLRFLE